jgi:hypothetical protein
VCLGFRQCSACPLELHTPFLRGTSWAHYDISESYGWTHDRFHRSLKICLDCNSLTGFCGANGIISTLRWLSDS